MKFVPLRDRSIWPDLVTKYAPDGPTGSNSMGHPPYVLEFNTFPLTSIDDQVRPPFVLT